jgi:hypothetical protein
MVNPQARLAGAAGMGRYTLALYLAVHGHTERVAHPPRQSLRPPALGAGRLLPDHHEEIDPQDKLVRPDVTRPERTG